MSDLIETLELMCEQNEIQEVPRSFLVDLRDEIERLTALTEADGKEIGSYRDGTGLRGEWRALQTRVEKLEGDRERIEQWCKAYPRTVFIEPTKEQWRIANETLDAHKGDNCPSLTAISGSNMRHVVEGIQALAATEQGDGDE